MNAPTGQALALAEFMRALNITTSDPAASGLGLDNNPEHPRQGTTAALPDCKILVELRSQGWLFFPSFSASPPKAFQPEPGCSEPTFVGSAADSALLAGVRPNLVAGEWAHPAPTPAVAHVHKTPRAVAARASFVDALR